MAKRFEHSALSGTAKLRQSSCDVIFKGPAVTAGALDHNPAAIFQIAAGNFAISFLAYCYFAAGMTSFWLNIYIRIIFELFAIFRRP